MVSSNKTRCSILARQVERNLTRELVSAQESSHFYPWTEFRLQVSFHHFHFPSDQTVINYCNGGSLLLPVFVVQKSALQPAENRFWRLPVILITAGAVSWCSGLSRCQPCNFPIRVWFWRILSCWFCHIIAKSFSHSRMMMLRTFSTFDLDCDPREKLFVWFYIWRRLREIISWKFVKKLNSEGMSYRFRRGKKLIQIAD